MFVVLSALGRRIRSIHAVSAVWVVLILGAFPKSTFAQSSTFTESTPPKNIDAKVSVTPRPSFTREKVESDAPTIRIRTDWVYVPTLVTDGTGRPVQGMRKQDFKIFEDGVAQELSEVLVQDGPISVGVVFDASASMEDKMTQAREAVSQFLRLSDPNDDFFLITFKDQPELRRGFTTVAANIEDALAAVAPKGWTALYDAMYLGINHLKGGQSKRRVLFVVSDGGDNNSRYNEAELRSLVRETDVRIFSISIKSRTPALEKLAAETGGRAYRVSDLDELTRVAEAISTEAHSEYLLGYLPGDQLRDGKYHSVKVELANPAGAPGWRLSWRRGYFSQFE